MQKSKEPFFFSKQVAQANRFYIEGSLAKDNPIKVVCGGCEHTRPDYQIDRKDFPYYSIEFVARGKGVAVLNSKKYDLVPGTVFTYGPHVSQFITTAPKYPMVKYFIDFTGAGAKKILKRYISIPGTALRVSNPHEISGIFDDLIRHGSSDSPYRSLICSTLLEYLVLRIAETKVAEEIKLSRACITYQNCRQHIKENYVKLKSLQDISESCDIDNAYLCRLFKRFDTQSPYQYLMRLKMAFAAEYLQKPGILIKEIACELGFKDAFHFSRAFKKIFGVSPSSFRGLR